MGWPGWKDVLPVVVAVVTAVGAIVTATWGLGRIFRPWMRDAARNEADRVTAAVQELANKLATNDFPHLEDRFDKGLRETGERIKRVEDRIEKRLTEARADQTKRFDRIEGFLDRLVGGSSPK